MKSICHFSLANIVLFLNFLSKNDGIFMSFIWIHYPSNSTIILFIEIHISHVLLTQAISNLMFIHTPWYVCTLHFKSLPVSVWLSSTHLIEMMLIWHHFYCNCEDANWVWSTSLFIKYFHREKHSYFFESKCTYPCTYYSSESANTDDQKQL